MLQNPVIEKELKTRMRGWKAPAVVTAYLAFLVLVLYLYFLLSGQLQEDELIYFNPRIAVNSYYFLASFQFGLLLFIVPILTCGAICGERERQTLDLLLCTNFPTISIITGKLVVSIAHILLLIIASLPIMSSIFLFGGIEIEDLLLLAFFYTITALMVGSLGIFYSTVFRKTIVAIIFTYITLGFLSVGTIVIMAVWAAVNQIRTALEAWQVYLFLFSNPLFGFSSIVFGDDAYVSAIFRSITYRSLVFAFRWFKPWVANMVFDVIAAIVLVKVSAWRIKPIKASKRRDVVKSKKETREE